MIITGLSGAGMSSALKTLEDFGFEVFDNFPLSLVEPLLSDPEKPKQPIAIGIDIRSRNFNVKAIIGAAKKHSAELLFMTCDETTLQKRFTETRRRHPLAKNQPMTAGIQQERNMLEPLKKQADLTIDTAQLSIHDLRHILKGHCNIEPEEGLTLTLISFGFRHGLPRTADMVMDVRFLKNPHWEPALKEKTGKQQEVGAYITTDPSYEPFMEHLKNLIKTLLPRYGKEGKSYLTIAIGCTGGRHRSVFIAETLKSWLKETGTHAHIEHRDLEK